MPWLGHSWQWSFSWRSLSMKMAFLRCGVQTRCWRLSPHCPGSQAKLAHAHFWRVSSLRVPVGQALPHSFRHEAKLDTLTSLAQLKPDLPMGDNNPAWNPKYTDIRSYALAVRLSTRALRQEVVRSALACPLPLRFPHKMLCRILRTYIVTMTTSACPQA